MTPAERRFYDERVSAARRGLLLACAAALLAVAAGPVRAQAPDAGLRTRLDALERALRDGNAGALRDSVSSRARVHVDLRGLTDGQQIWAAGQLEVAFAGFFAARRATGFALQHASLDRAGDDLAFVRGTWTRSAAGGPVVEGLAFTLRIESGDWRVFEIRTTR